MLSSRCSGQAPNLALFVFPLSHSHNLSKEAAWIRLRAERNRQLNQWFTYSHQSRSQVELFLTAPAEPLTRQPWGDVRRPISRSWYFTKPEWYLIFYRQLMKYHRAACGLPDDR
jgi:hypothetical protein